ncbi:MAG: hypothetical protein MZW92_58075 [Comamonadaceae bacterium]|nr:hypothetical protein [Comamonadaceae bacterium]
MGAVIGALAGAAIDDRRGMGDAAAAEHAGGVMVGAGRVRPPRRTRSAATTSPRQQCMYTKGSLVPGYGYLAIGARPPRRRAAPPHAGQVARVTSR